MSIGKITTCLWFDTQAEEAANHYVAAFGGDSKITSTQHYTSGGKEFHGREPGSVMVVEFELRGNRFVGLNGGPAKWNFNEAVSFQVDCDDQAEVDHFWEKLGEGGDESKRQCGWIPDKFGVSWQVVPKALKKMLGSDDKEAASRASVAMMHMRKFDIALLEQAFKG
ncbi:Glyoxalase/Bleomycin resistance protein/Dihydroxybiphenyl dioxygenase [Dactylonectria estremocensis]|uniref:Glyoxalase/Bleomycin resistance protein/Dihydroxybiphenyl dioxygenase n=1 Tax=Dactylonectria estremocensis TaxID=1079267 RepID=A0A9P9J433_9HYPO|nr:Glyoxalase/Bleomycin resistance protein/Dihydroxybiphenyl dioxygenase [Dactylonectria estremocensis]